MGMSKDVLVVYVKPEESILLFDTLLVSAEAVVASLVLHTKQLNKLNMKKGLLKFILISWKLLISDTIFYLISIIILFINTYLFWNILEHVLNNIRVLYIPTKQTKFSLKKYMTRKLNS